LAGLALFLCVNVANAQSRTDISAADQGFTITNKTLKGNAAVYKISNPQIDQAFVNAFQNAGEYLSINIDALFDSYTFNLAEKSMELKTANGIEVNDNTVVQVLTMLMETTSKQAKTGAQNIRD
jgi:hypothetical protein